MEDIVNQKIKMMSDNVANDICFAKSLLKLRLKLEDYNEDKRFEKTGDIYYAVDTNIVLFYANPEKDSKYASVFDDDDDDVRKAMSWSLCEYIFSFLPQKRPLLIIPPHVSELERVLRSKLNDSAIEAQIFLKIPNSIKELVIDKEIKKNPKKLLYKLEEEALGLIRYALGKEYSGQIETSIIERVCDIIKAKKIINIEKYGEYDDWCFPELDMVNNIDHYRFQKKYTEYWYKLIQSFNDRNLTDKNKYDDARVLSKLQWINKEINPQNKRLVLITADQNIQKAADISDIGCDYGSFMDKYIRDPRSFFGDPEFIGKNENNEQGKKANFSDLHNQIDVIFSDYFSKNENKREKIKEILIDDGRLKYYLSGIEDKRQRIKKDWDDIVKVGSVSYSLKECKKSHDDILKDISNSDIKGLSDILYERFFLVWLSFWRATTRAGFITMRNIGNVVNEESGYFARMPIRGVPILNIKFKEARKQLHQLCKSLIYEKVIENNDLFIELRDEDPSGYAAFLLYAVAFGMTGQWKMTKTLAQVAYQISDYIDENEQPNDGTEDITGSEAAYLLAWSTRNDAKNINDLDEAEKFLFQASKRTEKVITIMIVEIIVMRVRRYGYLLQEYCITILLINVNIKCFSLIY